MKPIIIPVENGKVTFTLADFRKYMEEAYNQGYSDGCSTGTITNVPYSPYWWREPYCNLSATSTSDSTVPEATLTNKTTVGHIYADSTVTEVKGDINHV